LLSLTYELVRGVHGDPFLRIDGSGGGSSDGGDGGDDSGGV